MPRCRRLNAARANWVVANWVAGLWLAGIWVAVLFAAGCSGSATVDSGLQGSLLYGAFDADENHQVFRLDLQTREAEQITNNTSEVGAAAARHSPDGGALVVAEYRSDLGRVVIARYENNERQSTVLSDTSADETLPAWSASCQSILFARFTDDLSGSGAIWQMQADGSGRQVIFASTGGLATGPDRSYHHDQVLFMSGHDADSVGMSIYAVDLDTGPPRRVTPVEMNAAWGRWSPVADEIVFTEITAGGSESRVAVIAGDGTDLRYLTGFADSYRLPIWSPDGEWVIYRNENDGLVAINPETSAEIDLGLEGIAYDWGPHGRTCVGATAIVPRP